MAKKINLKTFKVILVFALAAGFVLYCCSPVLATTYFVNPGESIQTAINAARYGDAVQVAGGTYYERITLKDGVVVSGTRVRTAVINGLSKGSVVTSSACGPHTILSGFTITNGSANLGGGMYNSSNSNPIVTNCTFTGNSAVNQGGGMCNALDSNPTVTDCTFTGNSADTGGGIFNNVTSSQTTVTDCTFTDNTAVNQGGGMVARYSVVTGCTFTDNSAGAGGGMVASYSVVTGCTFTDNSAGDGGGMFDVYSVTNCTFTGNSALSQGGGMFSRSGNPTVTNCTFTGNSANLGGGIYICGNSSLENRATVTSCTFTGNTAVNQGGGIRNYSFTRTTVTNCMFSGNSADYGGGMGNRADSNPIVTNCTFTGNSAVNQGGGMHNARNSRPIVTNCIMWDNTAVAYPDVYDEISFDNGFSQPIIYYSDINGCGGSGTDWNPYFGSDYGGSIDADPLFVDPNGPDEIVGTEDDNLRLMPDSPCIDSGDNDSVSSDTADLDNDGNTVEPIPWDIDGHPRIIDGDCNDTEIVDMGAYEFNYAYIGDFDYNCKVNFGDFAILGLAWLTEPPDADWNHFCNISDTIDNIIDELDLDVFCDNWLFGK